MPALHTTQTLPGSADTRRVPLAAVDRARLRRQAREYALRHDLSPGIALETLREHGQALALAAGLPAAQVDFATLALSNATWLDELALVPYERRLLVLPSHPSDDRCTRPTCADGAVCSHCVLPEIAAQATRLGYLVVVADNPFEVQAQIADHPVDAVIGISCLAVLETVFPMVSAAGLPAAAVPLLDEHCAHGALDLDWVTELVELTGHDRARGLDLESWRRQVYDWFTPAGLDTLMGPVTTDTEAVCRAWLSRDGKRWRPFLALCVYEALRPDPGAPAPLGLRQLAVAVECFHKASLVHDDIEDEDDLRYGEATLHAEYGVPIALNAGDLILGHGYRLIGVCGAPPERIVAMLQSAADGHRALCEGQGAELAWQHKPVPLGVEAVLDIFSKKTAPAFDVALKLGAIHAGADAATLAILGHYSRLLGIAYQIRDDLDDFGEHAESNDLRGHRPSLLMALAYDRSEGSDHDLLGRLWRRDVEFDDVADAVYDIYARLDVVSAARHMLHQHRNEAVRSLRELTDPTLRGLLRRVLSRIFPQV